MVPQKKILVLPKQNALIKCRQVNVCIILLPDPQSVSGVVTCTSNVLHKRFLQTRIQVRTIRRLVVMSVWLPSVWKCSLAFLYLSLT